MDIIGTATTQITEISAARFDAEVSGGFPASYSYAWSVTSGTLISGQGTASMLWDSPSTGGNTFLATVSLLVDDGTQQASKTLNILVTPLDPPTVELSPAHGAIAFTGSAIPFSGYGTDSRNLAIPAASMTWYLDGTPWAGKSGLSSFIANPGDLTPGVHQVSLAVSDFLGYVTSATHTVTYGYAAADITLPVASGTRFDTGATINFTATPAPVPGLATFSWLLDGNVMTTNVANYSTAGIASGWHAISYYGTDSFAGVSSSTIGVWVNSLPVIGPITVTSPAQFATGPAGEQIFTKIGGEGINFSCSATDLESAGNLPGAALSWYINGDPATKSIGLNFIWLVDSPASLTIRCIATDSWGYAVSTSTVIWAWDWEQYTSDIVPGNSRFYANPGPLNSGTLLNNPTAIQAIDNTTLVVADTGNNRLIKVVRTNDGGLTTDGDINGAALDTVSPSPFSSGLTDLSYYSGQLYTLEKNAPVSLKRINPADFLVIEAITYPVGANNLNLPEGVVRGAGVFYVSDTSVGVVRRIDSSNGFFFSESVQVTTPFKLKLNSSGTYLYVTDQAAGKLYKYSSDLNPMSQQWVTNATSATDIVLTDTYILVSDVVNSKIYVHRQSDGGYVYEFGSTAANNLQNPFGLAVLGNDLYIVERTNPGRITRIRSHGW
ncbi:MAG: hypothetical protein CVV41_22050 [Candidatus Riflebacteria bacterium HGW-Riflebacteria-1]|nr:MAG: hypothetical protein CVV41_22050 [Candidatus Riflebacteria bacterium HGW-Riflebacteria-1]